MAFSAEQLLDKVNTYLATMPYMREPKGLYAPIEYVLSLGGKRIRPVLMLLSYQLYKENVDDILSQAAGIETYHNYTLLHDDLMDRADMRRNKPTVHKVWDENTAILSGDAMLVLAYRLMNNCPDSYLKQVMDARKLYDFGIKMGLAFQLQDDFLDVYGNPKVFGKNIGGDILCNKKTFMLINALTLADGHQRKELEKWISSTDFYPEEKIKAVTELYDKIGIGRICEEKINAYYAEGLSLLESIAMPSGKKEELKSFVCHLMNRKV